MIFSCSTLCQLPESSRNIGKFRKTRVSIDPRRALISLSFQSQYPTIHANLTDNIQKLSNRFVSDGKFSLTLRQPSRIISFREVSPATARTVCRYLSYIQNGAQFSSDSLVLTLDVQKKPITELLIEELRDYPFGTSFPSSVENIHIKNIKLESFDTRILQLIHLSVLVIENSKISVITEDIRNLRLVRLCLNSNMLSSWPSITKESPLSSSLTYLDLSGNRISVLPENFWNLNNLETLNLGDNLLIGLPPVNLHRIRCLRNISLRNNQLQCLPFTFSCLQLTGTLDLSNNPWMAPCRPYFTDFEPKSLFHYAATSFLGEYARLFWSGSMVKVEAQLPQRVAIDAFGVLRRCVVCLKMCGPESERFVDSVELHFTQRVVSGPSSIIHYCCSNRCAERFNST